MKHLFKIYLGLILVSGCATTERDLRYMVHGENDKLVYVHQCYLPVLIGAKDIPSGMMEIVKQSAIYWNKAAQKELFMWLGEVPYGYGDPRSFGYIPVQIVNRDALYSNVHNRSCGNAHQIINSIDGCLMRADVLIAAECTDDLAEFETIIRHEFGHLLGLRDVRDNWTTLMSGALEPTVQHPVDANDEEIQTVKDIYKNTTSLIPFDMSEAEKIW